MAQVVSHSLSIPHSAPVLKAFSAPILLSKRVHGLLTLAVFADQQGKLFGTINHRIKVALRGLPSVIREKDLPNALKTLSEGILSWNQRAITFQPRLLGGAPPESAHVAGMAIWGVIPKKNSAFVGREPLLLEMRRRLTENGEAARMAIAGMGGVGKTSLVIEYLHRNKNNYTTVWWISGEYPMSGYRDLGEALGIIQPTDKGDIVLEIVKRWLETHSNWVLVFDNVEDPNTIAPFLPTAGKGGHIITTSRNPHSSNSLIVNLFSPAESVELLTLLTGQPVSAQTKQLAEVLDHLPLALTQAGAYMKTTQTSFSKYLTIFEAERKALWQDEKAPKDYPATVGTTWSLSVKQIQAEMPDALELLYRSSYLAPDNIPKFLFFTEGQQPLDLAKWLHKLQAYSFFTIGQEGDTYSVHRLIQASTRDNIDPPQEKALLQTIQTRLTKEWDFDYQRPPTWPKASLLLTHLQSFADHGKRNQEFLPQIAYFLGELGVWSTQIEINLPRAVDYQTQSLTIRKGVFGEKHPTIATSLNNLGLAYLSQSKLPLAVNCFQQSLAINKELKRENHPDVALALNCLGLASKELGNPIFAIACFTQALTIWKNASGENHSTIATGLNNLGLTYRDLGNFPLAIDYHNQSLAIDKRVWGDNHQEVAVDLGNLGMVYQLQKNYSMALNLYTQALTIYKNTYGENHPSVAGSLSNLASVHKANRSLNLAIRYYTEALEIYQKTFGGNHPLIAISLNNLGLSYHSDRNYPLALNYLNQSLAMSRKLYPEGHPSVQSVKKSLRIVNEDATRCTIS